MTIDGDAKLSKFRGLTYGLILSVRCIVGASEIHVDRRSGEPRRHTEDIDGDGDADLVLHFRLGNTDLTCGSEIGVLEGETLDGQTIKGVDSVRMIDRGGRP